MKIHELERKLKEAGCYFIMHGKKHDHWYSPIRERKFIIARHGAKEIPKGTLIQNNQAYYCIKKTKKWID